MTEPKFGATGQFPDGKIDPSDEGEITLAIAWDEQHKIVRIEFGEQVAWLGLTKAHAVSLAKLLLKHAGAKRVEISF